MTEAEKWEKAADIARMLLAPGVAAKARKLRLFGVACCRSVPQWAGDEQLAAGLSAAEAFADGELTDADLWAARGPLDERARAAGERRPGRVTKQMRLESLAMLTCRAVLDHSRPFVAAGAGVDLLGSRDILGDRLASELRQLFPRLLRDIFGNPFRPVAFAPVWRTGTAVALARQMYETRDFSAMPILADALQEAGCGNEDILDHCRGPGPHARGCWVVDLLLGKE